MMNKSLLGMPCCIPFFSGISFLSDLSFYYFLISALILIQKLYEHEKNNVIFKYDFHTIVCS